MKAYEDRASRSRARRRAGAFVALAFVLGLGSAAVADLAGWSVLESEDDGVSRRVVVTDDQGRVVVDERLQHGTDLFLLEDDDQDAKALEVR